MFMELTEEEVLGVDGGVPVWLIPAAKAVGEGILIGIGTWCADKAYEAVKSWFTD